MAYVPDRGHIIYLQFDPASGHEMKGPHFALVISAKAFNARGLAMVCPISQGAAAGARTHGTMVSLMGTGTDTQGMVHCHQLKALDWRDRLAQFKESVGADVSDEVAGRREAILFGD